MDTSHINKVKTPQHDGTPRARFCSANFSFSWPLFDFLWAFDILACVVAQSDARMMRRRAIILCSLMRAVARCQIIVPHALCAGSALCVPRHAQGSKVEFAAWSAGCGDGVSCLTRPRGALMPLIGLGKNQAFLVTYRPLASPAKNALVRARANSCWL